MVIAVPSLDKASFSPPLRSIAETSPVSSNLLTDLWKRFQRWRNPDPSPPTNQPDVEMSGGLPGGLPPGMAKKLEELLSGGLGGGRFSLGPLTMLTMSSGPGGDLDDSGHHPLDTGEDPEDSRPALQFNPEAAVELDQDNVSIKYDKEAWLKFFKSSRSIGARQSPLLSMMGNSRKRVPLTPSTFCSDLQDNEVSADIRATAGLDGIVVIEVEFPWMISDPTDALSFSRESQLAAIKRIEEAVKTVSRSFGDGILLKVDPTTRTIDVVFKSSSFSLEQMGDEFDKAIKTASATVDFLNRLALIEEKKINFNLEAPQKIEAPGSKPEHEFDIDKLALKSKPEERLTSIGGSQKLIDQLVEIIEFYKNPDHFKKFGITQIGNVLLYGPSGTGKTLSAKVVAGELDIPFYEVRTSDLLSSWYGDSERNVRSLFEKVEAPCVLFFDEIDALGRSREKSDSLSGRVLNEVLIQLDGMSSRSGILCIGATNLHEALDPALTRPGRFSHKVYVGRPDQKGKEQILKIHQDRITASVEDPTLLISKSIDLSQVAREAKDFVGADLKEIWMRAQMTVARRALRDKDHPIKIDTDLLLEEIRDYETERTARETEKRIGFDTIPGVMDSPREKLRHRGES